MKASRNASNRYSLTENWRSRPELIDAVNAIFSGLKLPFIPSVLYSTDNIFDSAEADEMEKILIGTVDPTSHSKLKAAMATDIMGVRADDMVAGDPASRRWENRTAAFMEYHRDWESFGFIRMLRQFMTHEHVKERLLRLPDGERKLTNVLHLAEILHRQSVQTNSGVAGLLKFLADQRDPGTPRLEEHQLRLESDEKAIKIVTIHKSKGLEYPVVFCPFAWEGSQVRGTEFAFHDIDDDRRLTLDLGSELSSRHRILAQNEALSENLRLLYVALARARKCCYLAWGRINAAETSALAYLLHCDDTQSAASPIEDITQPAIHQRDFFRSPVFRFYRCSGQDVDSRIPQRSERSAA